MTTPGVPAVPGPTVAPIVFFRPLSIDLFPEPPPPFFDEIDPFVERLN